MVLQNVIFMRVLENTTTITNIDAGFQGVVAGVTRPTGLHGHSLANGNPYSMSQASGPSCVHSFADPADAVWVPASARTTRV
jgi:hypothetical protein